MARVRECDRCGKYYPWYGKLNVGNSVGTATYNMDNESVGDTTFYDLCPECMDEFHKWFAEPNVPKIPVVESVPWEDDGK